MKKLMTLTPILFATTACGTGESSNTSPVIGMPNPASAYCVEQSGEVEIRNEAAGQAGYCHLPDGRVIEEWEFFRLHSEG